MSIDSLVFDIAGLELVKQVDGEKFLVDTQGGEIVSLAFFRPHDFEWDALSPELHRRYEYVNQAAGGALIDCQVKKSAGLEGIRVVSKGWAQSEGLAKAYCASLSVILEDCCYILKVMSQESGTTGVREAMVAMLQFQRGELPQAGKIGQHESADAKTVGSMDEFVAISRQGPMQRIEADDARYDETFSDHPLSRVRAILDRLEASFRPDPGLAQAKPFRLPREGQPH